MILANTKNYPCEKVTRPSLGLTPSPLGTMSCTIFHLCQVSGETCLNFCYVASMCSQCFISVSIFSCIYISDDTDFLEHALFFMFLFPLPLLRFQFLLFLVFWIISHLRSIRPKRLGWEYQLNWKLISFPKISVLCKKPEILYDLNRGKRACHLGRWVFRMRFNWFRKWKIKGLS